ncbi:hypothetical protein GCM10025883_26190 [Mobilicoccus caccae]|uniref:Amidohydrolase 3 domain-containing protein n=2 Tax=Mobilicoccus caccae TaxID=1859295 RepID=A0ABQ6IV49_9MICO|nr:amidohydrolase family protein [Mobilicoccus caccae]GMA40574.1 hypothetical protein GCM10025883_26190 [Mobilicoccus caccae]
MTSSANAITYTNAKVFTGSGPEDFVSAFTIEDGVFTWTGESEDVTATDAVDLGGATVLPGLLDVHTHPIFMATLADSMTLLQPEVTSLESMLDALRRHPDLGAGPQAWVMGFGYNEAKYPDGAPDRHALDRVSTEQPVFARRADGHTAVCNTFALDLAGITRDTPDPAGGRIVRDASGEPTGVLEETSAVDLVYRVKPAPDSAEIARRLAGLSEHFLEFGLVAVDDLYGNFVDEPLAVTRAAVDQGYRPQSSVFLVWGHDALPALTDADRTGQARVGGSQGVPGRGLQQPHRLGRMRLPRLRGPRDHHDHRRGVAQRRGLGAGERRADGRARHGRPRDQPPDRPLRRRGAVARGPPLDPVRPLDPVHPRHDARVIEARMRFGVISHSVFFYAEYDSYETSLGEEQFAIAYPLRTMYENLPDVAIASDSPATAWADCDNPFISVMAAVCRRAYNGADINQAEAISVGQALELYTGRAARITGNRGVGLVAPGYEGNFVVLDRDVFTIEESTIDQTRVMRTYLRGELAFSR